MECNREEAVRARVLAEQKLASQDYVSAKKYVMKAQQLFPGLENMGHMMAVIDVHMAALVKIGASNVMDWYGILQLEPNADEVAVKKQYRKLALYLHPDKNKFAGAESAFKLIGEASQVLSDKTRRLVYNAKRGVARTRTTRTPVRNQRASGVDKHYPEQNGHGAASFNAQHFTAARPQAELHPFTFWTACTLCHMRYQYFRKFENQNLLCPNCRKPFFARDLSRVHPTQAPFSQTGQSKSCAGPTAGTAGINGFANGSQKFPSATTPIYTAGTDSTNPPNGTKVTENAEAEKELRRKAHEFLRSTELQKESAKQTAESNSTKVTDCGTNLPDGTNVAEKAEVKKKVEDIERVVEQVVKQTEQAKTTKVTDCAADFPNGTKVAENVKVEKQPSRKTEDIRRLMELAKQKEQLKSTNLSGKNQGESAQSKMEKQAGTTENIKKEHIEKASFKMKRKRGKKQYHSSSSETEGEGENWGKVATDWKGNPPRRSSRAKRNVTYNCNESDDDFQNMPLNKKARVEEEVGPSQQGSKCSDTADKLADLANSAIRTKLNLQSTTAVPMMHEAKIGNVTCHHEGKKPETLESETEYLNSTGGVSMASFDVQDAEFHNFDEGREEKDVEVGQVWALYDDKDGMPKYYMKVKEVRSRTPFRVSVGWFEMRKPSEEIRELLDLDFSFTCGEFIMSSTQVMHSVNSFSHLVNWEKAGKGIIRTYPKKGQIWCLYEDWKCGQQLFKIDDIPSKYCMVEVLIDCNETSGVTVMLLKKVEGLKTIFQSSDDRVIQVPFLEVLRFSHQVPAYKLKGNELPNLPKDCWELDPAAVPSSLICPNATSPFHS